MSARRLYVCTPTEPLEGLSISNAVSIYDLSDKTTLEPVIKEFLSLRLGRELPIIVPLTFVDMRVNTMAINNMNRDHFRRQFLTYKE